MKEKTPCFKFHLPCGKRAASCFTLSEPHVTLATPRSTLAMPREKHETSHVTLSEPHVMLATPRSTLALPCGKHETSYVTLSEPHVTLEMPRSTLALPCGKRETSRCVLEIPHCKLRLRCRKRTAQLFTNCREENSGAEGIALQRFGKSHVLVQPRPVAALERFCNLLHRAGENGKIRSIALMNTDNLICFSPHLFLNIVEDNRQFADKDLRQAAEDKHVVVCAAGRLKSLVRALFRSHPFSNKLQGLRDAVLKMLNQRGAVRKTAAAGRKSCCGKGIMTVRIREQSDRTKASPGTITPQPDCGEQHLPRLISGIDCLIQTDAHFGAAAGRRAGLLALVFMREDKERGAVLRRSAERKHPHPKGLRGRFNAAKEAAFQQAEGVWLRCFHCSGDCGPCPEPPAAAQGSSAEDFMLRELLRAKIKRRTDALNLKCECVNHFVIFNPFFIRSSIPSHDYAHLNASTRQLGLNPFFVRSSLPMIPQRENL
jgi:hypothetical protein